MLPVLPSFSCSVGVLLTFFVFVMLIEPMDTAAYILGFIAFGALFLWNVALWIHRVVLFRRTRISTHKNSVGISIEREQEEGRPDTIRTHVVVFPESHGWHHFVSCIANPEEAFSLFDPTVARQWAEASNENRNIDGTIKDRISSAISKCPENSMRISELKAVHTERQS